MSEAPAGAIRALAQATAGHLAEVATEATAAGTEWRRGSVPFAAVDGATLEVRLAPPVARAALRTPDTAASGRGPDWVRFAPVLLDQYAADRATSWIESAWRNAAL